MVAFAYKNQGLKQHSEKTMQYALEYASKNYAEVCVRRIKAASKTNINYSIDEFLELVRIAAILHDSGKAADKYQSQFNSPPPEKPSFSFHEIPSAIIAKTLMDRSGYSSDSILFVSLAVLFHHTAMRSFDQQERFLSSMRQPWTFTRCKSDLEDICSPIFGSEFPLRNIGKQEAKDFFEWIKRVAGNQNKSHFIKLYCLILNPVIYGDNIDAKSRGESERKSRFVEELEETING
ncbi:MAG: CRISPR-associated endonuclease Cas3'' [Candidatus Methanosuratincola petrocarbonis]